MPGPCGTAHCPARWGVRGACSSMAGRGSSAAGHGFCPTVRLSCCVSARARLALTAGSHKNRDKRCHIAAGLLRPALIGCLERNGVTVDEVGMSLARLDGPPLEELEGSEAEREAEVGRRIENIESVHGGQGGEVGVFNINHLGGHRYAGVMLVSV